MNMEYDVVIVGGGVSGTALLYTLTRYTSISRIALVEKYADIGSVNSRANNNSQTLHIGDIETNYSIEKATEVAPASGMVAHYAHALPEHVRSQILFPIHKMVLGVGTKEVATLEERFEKIRKIFPNLRKLNRAEIEAVEPMVVRGRAPHEPIVALANMGFAVDYQKLAQSFVDQTRARPDAQSRIQIFLGSSVTDVMRDIDGQWSVVRKHGEKLRARVVIFDADAYSLFFAKRLGFGKEFSLIPVAGTFFFTKQMLRGKVYTVQDPRLLFASIHGDMDVRVPGKTRWGPTARFVPVLEARNWKTAFDYLAISGVHRLATWKSFAVILLDPLRFWYLVRNVLYEIPLVAPYFFARQARKIVPTLTGRDFTRARGFGGMRLQRVNTNTHELLLGEGKIIGDNIIFNMTPSPGASVCLYNAVRDMEHIVRFLGIPDGYDKVRLQKELCGPHDSLTLHDTSLHTSYAS
jgi:malate dehydrogenase (quinone)